MRVLVTGANGFIGKNLVLRLNEKGIETLCFTRDSAVIDLSDLVSQTDYIVHLAGENRSDDPENFQTNNVELTKKICEAVRSVKRQVPIIFASSRQAELDNIYGRSKASAENILKSLSSETDNPVYIYRLPGVFGKFGKPNYNSVVATFCHNISRDLPVNVNNPASIIKLVYIDDVIDEFIALIQDEVIKKSSFIIEPEYEISLQELISHIEFFKKSRKSLITEKVGSGFLRKLYSTYVSFIPPDRFSYPVPAYGDERGVFAEMLKTRGSGQFSFFTAKPGVTRGGHYHHTKTEKFLVVSGRARFRFRHVVSGESYELKTNGNDLKIVETAPGWAHDITNLGNTEMVVILWANEVFDPEVPDTVGYAL